MKFLRLTTLTYSNAQKKLTSLDPNSTYQDVLKFLETQGTVYSTGLVVALRELGIDASQIYADSLLLQQAWWREFVGTPLPETLTEIVLKQIEIIKPDILYFQDDASMPIAVRKELKSRFPFIRKILMYKGYPNHLNQLRDVDHFFAGVPFMVDIARKEGLSTELMYHSFDHQIAERFASDKDHKISHEFTFFGASGAGNPGHRNRYWSLFQLFQETPLEAWLDETGAWKPLTKIPWMEQTRTQIIDWVESLLTHLPNQTAYYTHRMVEGYGFPKWIKAFGERIRTRQNLDRQMRELGIHFDKPHPRIGLGPMFPERVHPPVFGQELYQKLHESLVTFNIHTDAALGYAANMRLFEGGGAGACLLTDNGKNMRDLFEPDTEVITYNNLEECEEKLQYLLSRPSEARAIGMRAQKKVLSHHSSRQRAQQIKSYLDKI